MNGRRSISMRKGYLLTALAAAVLLAASSGTAYAQSIGFDRTAATLVEHASPDMDTATPLAVSINISGLTTEGDMANAKNGLGDITFEHDLDFGPDGVVGGNDNLEAGNRRVWLVVDSRASDGNAIRGDSVNFEETDFIMDGDLVALDSGDPIHYNGNGAIELKLIDPAGDANWKDDKGSMSLRPQTLGVSANPGSVRVTVSDIDPTPTVAWDPSSLTLLERSSAVDPIGINVVAGKAADPADDPEALSAVAGNIEFTISPAAAVLHDLQTGNPMDCDPDSEDDVLFIDFTNVENATRVGAAMGTLQTTGTVGNHVAGSTTTRAMLTVTACGDMAGYKDDQITLSFVASSLMSDDGTINSGSNLVITVDSNEEVPTVSFATTSILVDEGDTEAVVLISEGMATAGEVGMANVMVGGYGMISLWQDGTMLEENADGSYTVEFTGANARLTISADSDRALEDGMQSTATVTLVSANGANIGADDTLTVTINGSTAVAALPLVGQLLLALFLMAGGARLYRRRQG